MAAIPQLGLLWLFLFLNTFAAASLGTGQATCSLSCSDGWGDCDRLAGNGCEADLGTNPANCGACSNVCPEGTACIGGACDGTDPPPRRRWRRSLAGRTYTEKEKADLRKSLNEVIASNSVLYNHPLSLPDDLQLPKYHWKCPGAPEPWSLVDDGVERLGLAYVVTTAKGLVRRTILRDMFHAFRRYSFRVTFALGFPENEPGLERHTCQEQLAHGDLSLINMRDNMNSGKTFYSVKYVMDHIVRKQNYRYIMKLDDDTILHIPNLYNWMRKRTADFSQDNVMFGPKMGYYYGGSIYGVSSRLAQDVIGKVSMDYRGGHFEDALSGAWMRLGGSNITDVEFEGPQHYGVSYNLTKDEEVVSKHAQETIVIHQKKDVGEFLYLYQTLMLNTNAFLPN